MGKRIRKGNDIIISWALVDQERTPYTLPDKNIISVELSVRGKRYKVTDFSTDNNLIRFTFWGKDQQYTGSYSVRYIENSGKEEMLTFDLKDVFVLVDHSWQTGGLDDTVKTESIDLTSVVVQTIYESVIPKSIARVSYVDSEITKVYEAIPKKVSVFENDSDYVTGVRMEEYYSQTIPKKVSAFENDSLYITKDSDLVTVGEFNEIFD